MCTSQGLLSKAHDDPLYLVNHAYDGLRCGAPTVIREAPLECQTMVCSQKLYNRRLATLSTYHQLTPVSRRHHIYTVGGRGGATLYNPGFLAGGTPYSDVGCTHDPRRSRRQTLTLRTRIPIPYSATTVN